MSVRVDPKEIDQVIAYIQKIPFHIPLLFQDSKHNISLVAGLKDFNEVGRLKEVIRRNKFVLDLKVEIWTDVKNMPENLEIIKSQRFDSKIKVADSHMPYELDNIDLLLIEKLTNNSMQPFGKIAKEIGTSINTISRKYKKLKESGIIKPVLQINLTHLGYNAIMFFALKFASQSDTSSVIRNVMAIKDNTLIIKTSGEYDLLAFVIVKDLNQLLLTQDQVAKIPGILGLEMLVFPVWSPWPGIREYISTF